MGCKFTESELQLYHDGAMEEPLKADFSSHLTSCSSCRVQLQSLDTISQYVKNEWGKDSSLLYLQNLEETVLSQLEKEAPGVIPAQTGGKIIPLLKIMKVFATAAIMIIGIWGVWQAKEGKGLFMAKHTSPPVKNCEVDYFYSDSSGELVLYNVDQDTQIIYRLDSK
jgi:hypothetical protein